ncbi:MAG: hypothetical protein JXJ22_06165 [Bacteroidales bacterium]|nr:hypothetical protein [Bacteroidales bacterium]
MEIKGSAVKSIPEFVKQNYPGQFDKWLSLLPESSKEIFEKPVLPSNWYSLNDAAVVPTQALAEALFDNNGKEGAWQSGRYSAEAALTGVYKFFVRAASPHFIIGKASKIFSTYYRPCDMHVLNKLDNTVTLHITDFEEPNELIEFRIAGWMEKALEISGSKNVQVQITKSLTKGDEVSEYVLKWE